MPKIPQPAPAAGIVVPTNNLAASAHWVWFTLSPSFRNPLFPIRPDSVKLNPC
jgi:hypothetical protein